MLREEFYFNTVCAFALGVFLNLSFASAAGLHLACEPGKNDYFENSLQTLDTSCIPVTEDRPSGQSRATASNPQGPCEKNQPYINRNCIKASMETRGPVAGDHYYNCDDPNQVRPPAAVPPPCVSDKFIDYMTGQINKAMTCVNSGDNSDELPGEKLTGREIFGLYNHESRFMPNIAYPGGIGAAQLVRVGAQDFFTGPTAKTWAKIKDNPECSVFKTDVSDPQFVQDTSHHHVNYCQLTNIKVNPGRSFIMGLTIYKTFKKRIVKKMMPDYAVPKPNGMATEIPSERQASFYNEAERLAQTSYNAGVGRALRAYAKCKFSASCVSQYSHLEDLRWRLEADYFAPLPIPAELPDNVKAVLQNIMMKLIAIYAPTGASDNFNVDLVIAKSQIDQIIKALKLPASLQPVANKIMSELNKNTNPNLVYSEHVSADLRKLDKASQCKFIGL